MIGWPLGWLALMALVIHGVSFLGLLPSPRPAFDVDRTILLHQAEASQEQSKATTLLVGDSSCLMNVDALRLQNLLGPGERVINLGAISYLDLQAFGTLASNYARANPDTLRRVVLLMHPEALRLRHRNPYFAEILTNALRGTSTRHGIPPLVWATGAGDLRSRLLSRLVPSPLPGPWGEFYGFSRDLSDYLDANAGSAIDPRTYRAETVSGSAEYRLAPDLEAASKAFRQLIPDGAELWVGITPAPESFVLPDHEARCNAMLTTWGEWLGADQQLTRLPSSLEDRFFASTTHLNAKGREAFTERLARDLQVPEEPE